MLMAVMIRYVCRLLSALLAVALWSGCASVEPPPRPVQRIPAGVNLEAQVDRALTEFFGDLDRKSTTVVFVEKAAP